MADDVEVANEDDFEFNDTPYRDEQRLTPSFTVSVELHEEDPTADVWVFVDGSDTRIARQRFDYAEYHENGAYEHWLSVVLLNLHLDPEGREQCADCGNWAGHAPDCRYFGLPNPAELRY